MTDTMDSTSGTQSKPRRSLTGAVDMTTARRGSVENLTPEMLEILNRRRSSLDNLHVDKVAPWMHIHDFSEGDASSRKLTSHKSLPDPVDMTTAPRRGSIENMTPEMLEMLNRRRSSLEKLHVEKVAPWMHIHDFTEGEKFEQLNPNKNK